MFRRSKPREARSLPIPSEPTEYPAGSYIETEKGFFYILKDGKRYRIISERVLNSWNPPRVIKTSESAVSNYRVFAKLKFRNNTLIKDISNGKMYLIENGLRRWVVSPDALERIGVPPEDVDKHAILVSQQEAALQPLGKDFV